MVTTREQQLRAAIRRTRAFITWFRTIPSKHINLDQWLCSGVGQAIGPQGVVTHHDPRSATRLRTECGAVGCLGGWAEVSPMVRRYMARNPMLGVREGFRTRRIPIQDYFGTKLLVRDPALFSAHQTTLPAKREALNRLRTHVKTLTAALTDPNL